MSEAKWRHLDTISEALFDEGGWQWRGKDGATNCCPVFSDRKMSFGDFLQNVSMTQNKMAYGPIPDPPKEPPKLRRFTATCKIGGRVSGVYVEGKEEPYYVTYFFAGSLCCGDRVESELSDIHWLDT